MTCVYILRSRPVFCILKSTFAVSDQASVKQELTPIFENFRQELDRVSAHGDSAVYDALDLARSVLTNYRRDLPNLRRRIIIVSDGKDTNSESSAVEVCRALQNSRVIVDSVQVGSHSDNTLHAISVATGMYSYYQECYK